MISNTFNKYIRLFSILYPDKRLTFEEIESRWENNSMNNGEPLPKRTFHDYRRAIEELFGINILCDSANRYYIDSIEAMEKDYSRRWLFNSYSLTNMITASRKIKERILFEQIPNGLEYLQAIIEAMLQNVVLSVEYRQFGRERFTLRMQPYAMKVYHQRWYIVGKLNDQEGLRHIALDRIQNMELTEEHFSLPDDFDAESYYMHSVGIYVDDAKPLETVVIRVYGKSVEYLRTLPLHHSQQETLSAESYSEFEYRLSLTPDLTTQLLSMGDNVEVLKPESLQKEVAKRLETALSRYR